MARQRSRFTKGGQQEQVAGACQHGKHLQDLGRGACQHGHTALAGRIGSRQGLDVIGRHALEEVHAIGVRKRQYAAGRAALQGGACAQRLVFLLICRRIGEHNTLLYTHPSDLRRALCPYCSP